VYLKRLRAFCDNSVHTELQPSLNGRRCLYFHLNTNAPTCLNCYFDQYNFYRAALNAGRSSHEKDVCPSVCLSVCRTRELW